MKYCPECQANVEGLLYRCDCCGASLEQKEKSLFKCSIFELPQCLGLDSATRELIDALQPQNADEYNDFLELIGVSVICYPVWMLKNGKIRNKVYYSQKKKYVGITVIVNFDDFVKASEANDKDEKYSLVANALLSGIYSMQKRLQKSKLNVDVIMEKAEEILNKYIN